MGQWDQYINKTVNQQPVSGDGVPFLGIGKHAKLAIAEFFVDKTQAKGEAVVVYTVALESAVHAPGTLTKVLFTINANGLEGEYSRERLGNFVRQACNVQDPQQVGEQMAAALERGAMRGVIISADVVQATNKDGTPRLTKRGEPMGNPIWFHAPGQTGETIAQMRAWLDQTCPVRPKRVPPAAVAPAPQYAAQATAPVQAPATPPPAASPPAWPAGSVLPPGWK